MDNEYKAAIEAHSQACRKYNPIRLAYRRGEASDEEFLAARKEMDEATKTFDVAHDKAAA